MSTAIRTTDLILPIAPEGFHAGRACHLGSFSGRPRFMADAQYLVLEALENFENLKALPMQAIGWLSGPCLQNAWHSLPLTRKILGCT